MQRVVIFEVEEHLGFFLMYSTFQMLLSLYDTTWFRLFDLPSGCFSSLAVACILSMSSDLNLMRTQNHITKTAYDKELKHVHYTYYSTVPNYSLLTALSLIVPVSSSEGAKKDSTSSA